MPIYLRRFYSKKLLDVKTKESDKIKAQQAKATASAPRPSAPRPSRPSGSFR